MDVHLVGEGDTLIVAVHGIQGTRRAWSTVADLLAKEARFVLPNMRGRADAVRGNGVADYALDRYAADLAEVIAAHVGNRRFYLAGWSMGVSVSLEYLRLGLGPKPAGLILLSGTPALTEAPWFSETGDALLAQVADREQRLGLREAADHAAVAHTWTAISVVDHRPALAAIDVPTLVLHGRDDHDSPHAHGTWLAEGLPNARLVTYEGIGHSLLSQATRAVADEIRQFIAQNETTAERA